MGLVDLTFWRCWARHPKIVLSVSETIKGVTVACFNGI